LQPFPQKFCPKPSQEFLGKGSMNTSDLDSESRSKRLKIDEEIRQSEDIDWKEEAPPMSPVTRMNRFAPIDRTLGLDHIIDQLELHRDILHQQYVDNHELFEANRKLTAEINRLREQLKQLSQG